MRRKKPLGLRTYPENGSVMFALERGLLGVSGFTSQVALVGCLPHSKQFQGPSTGVGDALYCSGRHFAGAELPLREQ